MKEFDTRVHYLSEGLSTVDKDRDVPTLEAIYREYHDFVWRTLQRMGIRDADLHDVAHEVFLVVDRRLSSYDPSARLSAWLFGIALRVASGYRRKAYRRYEKLVDAPESASSRLEHDEQRGVEERRRMLASLLDTLDAEHRAVLVMYEIDGLSCESIAQEIGVPIGTVYSRLNRARRKLVRSAKRLESRASKEPAR